MLISLTSTRSLPDSKKKPWMQQRNSRRLSTQKWQPRRMLLTPTPRAKLPRTAWWKQQECVTRDRPRCSKLKTN